MSWLLFLALASCAGKAPSLGPPVAPGRDIELSLFLIGDGGEPNELGEPVLGPLAALRWSLPGVNVGHAAQPQLAAGGYRGR